MPRTHTRTTPSNCHSHTHPQHMRALLPQLTSSSTRGPGSGLIPGRYTHTHRAAARPHLPHLQGSPQTPQTLLHSTDAPCILQLLGIPGKF